MQSIKGRQKHTWGRINRRTGYRSYPFSSRQCYQIVLKFSSRKALAKRTLNQASIIFFLLSCFLSVCSFSNKPTRIEKGALPIFWGGVGWLDGSCSGWRWGPGELGADEGAGVGCIILRSSEIKKGIVLNDEAWIRVVYKLSCTTSTPWLCHDSIRRVICARLSSKLKKSSSKEPQWSFRPVSHICFLSISPLTAMVDISTPALRRKTTDDPKRIGLWKIGRTIGTGSSGTSQLWGRW